MNFSVRNFRVVVYLFGLMLIGLALFAGVRLWQSHRVPQPAKKIINNGRQLARTGNQTDPKNSFPASGNTGEINNLERREFIERLKEGREELAKRRYDKPSEAMEFFRLKRLPTGETELPVEKYLEAYRQMELMPQHTFGNDTLQPSRKQTSKNAVLPSWTSLGPGNIGGRTRAIVINPTTPTTMYAAGVAGGVWKSTNGGGSWTPTSDLMANLAVNSLAMDPTNPNTLYAGTGEGFSNGDAVRGAGIFKTTDGGTTWNQLANTSTTDFYYVNDIVVSPINANRIYAATRTGVWRTTDGGTNWTKALNATSVGSTTTAINGGCLDLAIRTDKPTDYVFASCGNFEQARIFRNTDAGAAGTWTEVYTEANAGRTSLAIAPSNQDIIYALSTELSGTFSNALHAVFRSTSSGDSGSWEARVRNTNSNKLNASLLSFAVFAFATNCGYDTVNFFDGQSWYDNVIAVDPADPNRVWTGGVDIFRSDDGGANWGMATHAYQSRTNPQYAHPDQHTIVFHPQYNGTSNQTVFIGNDGGIFRSDNSRAKVATGNQAPCNASVTSVTWTSLNNGYGVTQFYHGSVYPNGTRYFGGAQDNGTIRGSDSAGANAWNEISGGDGGYSAVDPVNTNNLYAAFTGISVQKSTDGGATFNFATSGISGDGGLFITPYTMDPSNPQRLFLGGTLYIWRTTNGANSWQRASAITPGVGSVSAITVSPTNANFALAGMSDGYILRTDQALTATGSTTWPSVQPRTGYVSSLAFDPTNKDIAYATYSTFGGVHVWKTVNAGVSWTGLNGTGTGILPDVPVHSIVVDPTNTMRLYIGTDVGVFGSVDGGATWAVENTGFANVATEWLTINSTSSTTQLFAFTHGRGAWRVTANPTGCNYVLTPASQTFTDAGGNGSFNVTAEPSGCNWTAVSNAAWITVTSGASSTTTGTVAFSVAAYNGTTPRVGTITAAGKTFTVTQNGCSTIASSFQYFEAAGGTGSIPVTATSGCTWTATGNPSWITINSGAAGTGNGTVAFTVAANTLTTARQITMTVAGQSFTVLQGGTNGSCAVTPIAFGQVINGTLVTSDCGSLRAPTFPTDRYSFTGTAGQRVAIRADSSVMDTFLYLIDPTGALIASNDDGDYRTSARIPSGTGFFTLPSNGAYQIEVLSALSTTTTGAYTVSLSAGSPICNYAAAPAEQNFAAAGGAGSINVTITGSGCDWTAVSNAPWVTINSGSTGSGNGTVNFTVAANTGFSRTAYLIVGGQLVTINQLGTGVTAVGKWVAQASGTTNQLNHVFFLDDTQGWTVGANSTARSTSNGGTSWNGFTIGGPLQNYNSVRFLDASNGWVGGERISALTSNGGSSFGGITFTTGTRNRLFPISTTNAFGVGERNGGGFHASTSLLLAFGIGSETPILPTLSNLRDLYLVNPSNGWSVGDNGQIFRMTKGGAFDEQTGVTAQTLNGVFALDLCTAWAVGDGGIILKTTNAGQTWTPQTSGVTTALRDIHFINADRGWAVGDAGIILVTWDGGANWTAEPSSVTANLRSVHTNTINAVYAVGDNGTVVKRALCTYTLSATTATFAETGGSGSVNVTSVAGCPWTATSNASWITINSGSPGSGNGTLSFTVAANTGLARTGTITVAGQTFTVSQPVACPTITGFTPVRSGVAGSVVITGTNLTEVTSVKFANNITAQFTVNSATQLTAIVPAGAVTGPITISKTGCGDVQTANFIVCNPITINPATLNAATTSLTFSQQLTATGGTAAYNYAVTTGTLPTGLTLTSGGLLSGVPLVVGTFNFTVTATDANGCTGTRAYSLTVACPTITLSPTTLPNGLIGSGYNQTVTASPTLNAGAYNYSVTTGSLPAGLSLNSTTGAITGTPTTAGTSNFTITALSVTPCSGSQSYSIFIQPLCPTVSGINPTSGVVGATVTITGTNLTGVDSVKFANGVTANFTVVSNTQITATVPSGAVTGTITVSKQFCSDATSASYTVLPTPTLTVTTPKLLIGVGQTASFTATISPALPTAITLSLSSSNPDVAAVPLNPSIPAGQTSVQFNITGGSAGMATINVAVPVLYGGAAESKTLNVAAGFEADVTPRPNGKVNGQVSAADWTQIGRFISGLDTVGAGTEFQRADCAPRATSGNGQLGATDWVQAGRYAAGLDEVVGMGGPTAPTSFAVEEPFSFTGASASLVRAEMVTDKSLTAAGKEQQVIKLTAQGGENALSFGLIFQASLWRFVSAELTDETSGASLVVNRSESAEGWLGFMFSYPTGKALSPGEYRLFTVTFEPVTSSSVEALFVGFSDYPIAREISDINANRLPSNFAADYSFAGLTANANVSAASFAADRLASEQIVAAFGENLATATLSAMTLPLPTTLGGATVKITDSKGVDQLAGLFFVSPGQINYLLPAGLAEGIARVTITANGKTSIGLIDVAPIAPSLFTANSDGRGLAAAVLLRVRGDGSQSYEPVTRFDAAQNRFVAVPIDFGEASDQLILLLYGTGLRQSKGRTIKATVSGVDTSVPFAGAVDGFAGLDQVNLNLPRSLTGRGEVEINLTIDGRAANIVKVVIR